MCPLDGKWGGWYEWTKCSKTCDTGQQTRRRLCNAPPPLFRGDYCRGNISEFRCTFLKLHKKKLNE